MERIVIDNFLLDMSLNEDGHAEASFTHEGKEFVIPITKKDAKTINHLFEMAEFEDNKI